MIIPLWQIRMENYTGWSLEFVSGKVWERKPNFNVGKCKVKRFRVYAGQEPLRMQPFGEGLEFM